jgi:hypothetical protein
MIDMQTIAKMTRAPRPVKVQFVYVEKKEENSFGGRLFTDVWILRVINGTNIFRSSRQLKGSDSG